MKRPTPRRCARCGDDVDGAPAVRGLVDWFAACALARLREWQALRPMRSGGDDGRTGVAQPESLVSATAEIEIATRRVPTFWAAYRSIVADHARLRANSSAALRGRWAKRTRSDCRGMRSNTRMAGARRIVHAVKRAALVT